MQNTLNKIQELANATELSITQAFPSIYTKENVVFIINQLIDEVQEILQLHVPEESLEHTLPTELQAKLFGTISANIEEDFDNVDADDLINFDSGEFEIDYGNQIQLSRVDVEVGLFKRDVLNTINNSIRSFFEQPQILAVDQE